jgi:hypothetical protein
MLEIGRSTEPGTLYFWHCNYLLAGCGYIIFLVERMLSLHKQLPEARTPHEKTALERQIEATDGQIDALVNELYGLTEEKIKIVQKASK